MASESTTALVALIVAWIALIIASLQLFQALFGTAEGYKRCAESVIGNWEGLRHRRFLLSELRFEVQYITPHILLVTPSKKQSLEDEHNKRHNQSPSKPPRDCVCILHEDVIQNLYNTFKSPSVRRASSWWSRRYIPGKGWLSRQYHPWEYSNKLRVLHSTIKDQLMPREDDGQVHCIKPVVHSDTLPFTIVSDMPGLSPVPDVSVFRGTDEDDDTRVTWDRLLREVCSVYSSYGDHPSVPRGFLRTQESHNHLEISADSNQDRTDAAITFKQWSWDNNPPEVVRPLATISIKDLVILAVRLGMSWKTLDFETGMSAEGHGLDLMGMKSDKLGYVFRLIVLGHKPRPWRLIPNQAADKLICGILPGCARLVKRDFAIVGKLRGSLLDLSRALHPNHIFAQIGLPQPARAFIKKRMAKQGGYASIHNEIVPLLCTFLPLKEDPTIVRHFGFCWRDKRRCIFHYWEGRFTLMYYLEQEVERDPDTAHRSGIDEVLEDFHRLKEQFPEDFLTLHHGSALQKQPVPRSGSETGPMRRASLVEACRTIHQRTEATLERLGLAQEDHQGRTHYQNLVTAHLRMAIRATAARRDEHDAAALPRGPLDHIVVPGDLKQIVDSLGTPRPGWLDCDMMANTKRYVEAMRSGLHAIVPFMRERDCDIPESDLVAAWWIMMLRGVVWDMSTIDHSWGQPIPASFYENHTTVWIT